ncbi:ABC transporter ATP-binding protein [Janibacter indicus]|uniref:ABC transporter ATP-binding protein n=1 Tax=Janibacter indicus TaxID=857417 RepID=A0A7L9J3W3_9MICO|nr:MULTISPECIES: ABC transporter ATP-binding protein [Janibacter]MCW4602892.1 ABC transporter ATP-binding protein [Janibacter hoylei]QOK23932.1 ABC transporter ATP-binding protein [Janibacter indicus]
MTTTSPTRAATPPVTDAIRLDGVTKRFRSGGQTVHAVRGVDLTITPGEVVALLGPNGAGKTTTLDMVLGLTEPTAGRITAFGSAPRTAVHEGRVSAVLQTGGLLRDLTARETVRLIASTFPRHRPLDEVIEQAGLAGRADRLVSKLSGGEQQRLRFALALLPDPDLLVLDEPTAGMDVTTRREFWRTMHTDASAGRTVLFATHYLEEADDFADRIVMMAGGRVVADGTTEEIRARASGRTVSVDIRRGDVHAAAERLRGLPGASSVTVTGDRLSVVGEDSDRLARILLTELDGTNLEVTTASLDAAFLAITGEPTTQEQS